MKHLVSEKMKHFELKKKNRLEISKPNLPNTCDRPANKKASPKFRKAFSQLAFRCKSVSVYPSAFPIYFAVAIVEYARGYDHYCNAVA